MGMQQNVTVCILTGKEIRYELFVDLVVPMHMHTTVAIMLSDRV